MQRFLQYFLRKIFIEVHLPSRDLGGPHSKVRDWARLATGSENFISGRNSQKQD